MMRAGYVMRKYLCKYDPADFINSTSRPKHLSDVFYLQKLPHLFNFQEFNFQVLLLTNRWRGRGTAITVQTLS